MFRPYLDAPKKQAKKSASLRVEDPVGHPVPASAYRSQWAPRSTSSSLPTTTTTRSRPTSRATPREVMVGGRPWGGRPALAAAGSAPRPDRAGQGARALGLVGQDS